MWWVPNERCMHPSNQPGVAPAAAQALHQVLGTGYISAALMPSPWSLTVTSFGSSCSPATSSGPLCLSYATCAQLRLLTCSAHQPATGLVTDGQRRITARRACAVCWLAGSSAVDVSSSAMCALDSWRQSHEWRWLLTGSSAVHDAVAWHAEHRWRWNAAPRQCLTLPASMCKGGYSCTPRLASDKCPTSTLTERGPEQLRRPMCGLHVQHLVMGGAGALKAAAPTHHQNGEQKE